jgi:hypothetical protein
LETQQEQNSQIDEYETLMQKETKPNLNEKFVIVAPFKISKINFCGLGTFSVES